MEQIKQPMNKSLQSQLRVNFLLNEQHLTTAWYLLLLIVIGNLVLFLIHLLQMPEGQLEQFIYDDGYYYLVLAKNFYEFHYWTFDSGMTITSGFQPLFAYCLTGLYALFKPNLTQFIHLSLCFTAFITVLTFIWAYTIKISHKWTLLAATALIASSLNFSYNAITLVEWPLLVFFASSYLAILYQTNIDTTFWRSAFLLALVGCLGSLTRADFGAMPLAFCCVAFILILQKKQYHYFLLTLSGLIGASIGVLLVFLNDYYFTGHILQNSATMKLLWEHVTGPSPYSFYAQLMSLLLGNFYRDAMPTLTSGVVYLFPKLLLLSILLFTYNIFRSSKTQNNESLPSNTLTIEFHKNFLFLVGSIITIIFYCIFYSYNTGAMQPWYSGNAIVPMVILVTGVLNSIRSNLLSYIISALLMIFIAMHLHHLYSLKVTPWASQRILYEAGSYLQQHPLPGKVGSWNAGIISYYEGQHIINLDGLMNDEIYPYAKADNLECYFIKKQINYVADFTAMFSNYHKARGGYTHNLQNWLTPIASFSPTAAESEYALIHHHTKLLDVKIFKVNLQGLAENNQC